jgi:hypothetical protein
LTAGFPVEENKRPVTVPAPVVAEACSATNKVINSEFMNVVAIISREAFSRKVKK